jgi:hypothetical protein
MVAVLVLAVAVLNRTSGNTTAAPTNTSSGAAKAATSGDGATAPTGTQPVTTTQNGIATGFPHTSEGAQSAAVNYADALGSSDMYASAKRHAIVTTVTTPSSTAHLQSTLDTQYAQLNKTLGLHDGVAPAGLTFVSRPLPVGAKLDSYSSDKATVEVWSDQLGGLAGTGSTKPVTEYWYTLTMQMQWSGNDWTIDSYTSVDGPAPISGNQQASTAQSLSAAVNQFGGLRYAR